MLLGNGWTGLHNACHKNSAAAIRELGRDDRCIPAMVNMETGSGETAVMLATQEGHMESVVEMARITGTDFGTKNSQGQTLLEVARERNYAQLVQFLEERSEEERLNTQGERSTPQLAPDVAAITLGSLRLRDIADELENIEAIEAVLVSEEISMQEKQNEEIESLEARHQEEHTQLEESHAREKTQLRTKQEEEKEEQTNMRSTNIKRKSELERQMQAHFSSCATSAPSTSSTPSPDVPECPVCMEEMKPPMQIFNCRNGHLTCADCRPKMTIAICTICRTEFTGRATAVEQMLRQMFNCQ
eukprot:GFUD01034529.1.p1 GENE.GFUD01034529.1~~GFUD01034529.1.p1  ORF type:complete len:302 (+),score=107.81 GFUD01034529.1:82-987(+)